MISHKPIDKTCQAYKNEEAALLKASAEHISVRNAKRQLGGQLNFAKAVKRQSNSSTPHQTIPPNSKAGAKVSGSDAPHAEPVASHSKANSLTKSSKALKVPPPSSPLPSPDSLSQASSLPNLGEIPSTQELLNSENQERMDDHPSGTRKRERQPSLSPKAKNAKIASTNRLDCRSSKSTEEINYSNQSNEENANSVVNTHREPRQIAKKDHSKKENNTKPNISRPRNLSNGSGKGTSKPKIGQGKASNKENSRK